MPEFTQNNGPNYPQMGPYQRDGSCGDSKIKLACRYMMPIAATAWSPDRQTHTNTHTS